MIQIFLGARMLRAIGELTPKSRDKLEETLSRVAENFGNPRQHAGLGLRKLGPAIWECRLDLSRRIILIQDEEALLAYDIMDHDALRAWLRS